MSTQASLFRIIQFGMIKVVPGVFNIVLIPYLLVALGTASYGLYSTWLGYAMLVANSLAAIASQPMYRYLSSHPGEREHFASFAVGVAGLAGLASFGVALMAGAPWLLALGFGGLSVGTVLGTAISIDFAINGRIARLTAYEAFRVLVILLALAVPVLAGAQLRIGHVVLALALSNLLPIMVLARRHRFGRLDAVWLRRIAPYGFKSATWLVLAGLPVVSAKSILLQAMPEHAFGTYAAIADLTYRAFAIANAALVMWAFPMLSRQFDEGRIAAVRRTLRFALLIYALGGVAVMAGGVVAVEGLLLFDISALPGGPLAAIAITLASFGWHGMSISHKLYELTLRTTQMAGLMALGVAAFYALTFSLIRIAGLDPLYVVTMSMSGVALIYSLISINQKANQY